MSRNNPFFSLSCLCGAFCYSNEELAELYFSWVVCVAIPDSVVEDPLESLCSLDLKTSGDIQAGEAPIS